MGRPQFSLPAESQAIDTVVTGSIPAGTNAIGGVTLPITQTAVVSSQLIAAGATYTSGLQTETVGANVSLGVAFVSSISKTIGISWYDTTGSSFLGSETSGAIVSTGGVLTSALKFAKYKATVTNNDGSDRTMVTLNKAVGY